ncbi:MAG TPA: hypothetical protein VF466_03830 [Candidatus Saccharimonadales bacterium]
MKYVFLLIAGLAASGTHFYLVWHHRDNRRYSVSEYAMLTRKSHLLYFMAHIVCEVLYLAYSYQFLLVEHNLHVPFYLNVGWAILDLVQATLPSRDRTEKIHFIAAYVSWCCFLLAGIITLSTLHVAQPYTAVAITLLIPTLGMFAYMHINRSKLYPYQLTMVPLFVLSMLVVTIGSR